MPGRDGTGPLGTGSMTGRGAGYCAGYSVPGYAGAGRFPGRGLRRATGLGCGRGAGWLGASAAGRPSARNFFGTMSRADEKALLIEQAEAVEGTLADIKQRLSRLEQGE
ncbi:MAG: DUF5320 domain-containing protein [bacterium]|nr:DUF5320 domain-containing protein [bacterium]